MNKRYVSLYMDLADRIAQMSYARRNKVGSVLVRGNTILSYGWNGMPSGWENNCEDVVFMDDAGGWISPDELDVLWPLIDENNNRYKLVTKPEVLHAELNCLAKVAQSTESSTGATLFCTLAPCIDCAKAILQAGITAVYYKDIYRSSSGLDFLRKSNINVHRHTNDL